MEKTNKINTVMVAYINGRAIYLDDESNIYCVEMPEEFAVFGTTALDEDLTKISELSEDERLLILKELQLN